MRLALTLLAILLASCSAVPKKSGPRHVVVITLDQMRGDMVADSSHLFGDGGFARLSREGAQYTHCYLNHATRARELTGYPQSLAAADSMLALSIDSLDRTLGRENYVLVVTAERGVAPLPETINADRMPGEPRLDAGRIQRNSMLLSVEKALIASFGMPKTTTYVKAASLPSIFLDEIALDEGGVERSAAVDIAVAALRSIPGVGVVARHDSLMQGSCPASMTEEECRLIVNAFDPEVSGDILVYAKRYWLFDGKPNTYGSWHDYDRWVPMLVLGTGVEPGVISDTVSQTDVLRDLGK